MYFHDAEGSGSDVSFVAVPQPTGVELGWLLGNADAPETFALKLDLPDGALVRRTPTDDPIPGDPPRTLEIIDRDHKTLAYITPPLTYDSDGVKVESSMRIAGRDRLIVNVKHAGEDLAWPLFVDPEVVAFSGTQVADWKGWSTYQVPATPTRVASDYNYNFYGWALHHPAYYPQGAYMSMPTNTFFDMGTSRGFEYRALPGSYVSQATFGNMAHSAIWPTGTYNMWWQGILNPPRNAWQSLWAAYHSASGATHHFISPGASDQNYANIGFGASAPNYGPWLVSGPFSASLTLDWANVYIADPNPPQLTSPPPADTGWSNATTRTRSISGWDLGTGLWAFHLAGPNIGQTVWSTTSPCHYANGNYEHACPIGQIVTKNFTYTPAEGSHLYSMAATDASGNSSALQAWTEKIDRSNPTITATGTLYDVATLPGDPGNVHMDNGSYPLQVTVSDALAGVASASVYVKKSTDSSYPSVPETHAVQTCPASQDGCSLALNWSFDANQHAAGDYDLRIVATDRASNASTPFDFSVTKAADSDIPAPPPLNTTVREWDISEPDPVDDSNPFKPDVVRQIAASPANPDTSEAAAPRATPSFYVPKAYDNDPAANNRLARAVGRALGRNHRRGVVILHLGSPNTDDGTVNKLTGSDVRVQLAQQVSEARNLVYGYYRALTPSYKEAGYSITVALGVTNDSNYVGIAPGSGATSDVTGKKLGDAVSDLTQFINFMGYKEHVSAAAGFDAEVNFRAYEFTSQYAQSVLAGTRYNEPLLLYGDAAGCPKPVIRRAADPKRGECSNPDHSWKMTDVIELATRDRTYTLPQIYHIYMARQWTNLQLLATRSAQRIKFRGVTNEYPRAHGTDKPDTAWSNFFTMLNVNDSTRQRTLPYIPQFQRDRLWLNANANP